jgi:hypothetical protein
MLRLEVSGAVRRIYIYIYVIRRQRVKGNKTKLKVKVTLEQATKTQRWRRGILSLNSALEGGGWSTPRPGRLTPGKDPVPIL